MNKMVGLNDFNEAAARINAHTHRTPIITSENMNKISGAKLYFKAENFQKVGAFKARGAVNAVFSLTETEIASGVATHSSGNHAAALAYAARLRNVAAYIVMPDNAPAVKKTAVAGYGGEIVVCRPTMAAREETLKEIINLKRACFIHPFNDWRVIVGQGTAALEMIAEIKDLEIIVTPVGGGGLISGTALAAHSLNHKIKIFGAEPEGADDAYRSLQAGRIIPMENPQTIADGLRSSTGSLTFPVMKKHLEEIITVSDIEIVEAMRLIWERIKIVVEPSSAVVLAAVLKQKESFRRKRVGLIISGGNVDLDSLPRIFSACE